ncbi:hypothetical protein O181_131254 [Austropuccinia psidii MF-1]|uniref:Uncharacterized protein n=1 Tax=Austropuccinia psidii MF-1 TaxID=1389203 RepID=A0A9Q3L2K0_9BASI|nr:hypothetical protein [Austropuccinia psidii MF-1]
MSLNLPLTTPITSLMNVSGFNTDVGNEMALPMTTCTIPDIYITQIPPNPTNEKMHISEGPGSTQENLSKANPHSDFLCDLLLNPGGNPLESQKLFGQIEQPSLNIP